MGLLRGGAGVNAKRLKELRREARAQSIGHDPNYVKRLYRRLKRAVKRGEKTVWIE